MRLLIATALLPIIAFRSSANEVGPPPITAETLVGIWEAAPAGQDVVYRLEVNKSATSYLALADGHRNLVYRLTSSEVRDGNVSLRFECLTDRRQSPVFRVRGGPEMNELWILGKGHADENWGIFEGTLRMKISAYDDDFTSLPVAFAKPPWTGDLRKLSKQSEALIKAAKSRHK